MLETLYDQINEAKTKQYYCNCHKTLQPATSRSTICKINLVAIGSRTLNDHKTMV